MCCDRTTDSSYPDDNSLPPVSQNGANTFGCKVDGIVFVPNKAIG